MSQIFFLVGTDPEPGPIIRWVDEDMYMYVELTVIRLRASSGIESDTIMWEEDEEVADWNEGTAEMIFEDNLNGRIVIIL